MKKYLLLIFAVFCIGMSSKAAPGDTTWVQANMANLSWYGNYDTTVSFPTPGTSYRKILMIFTLGKYMCPGYNPATAGTCTGCTGWCGDWDYTVLNYLMTPGGDTLELGRLITPYANALAPRTPWTATQVYTYDVTDYAYLLQGSATMRLLYSGYSGGFTGNVKFAFIEGVPDRDVIAIKRLWHGYFGYGDTSHHDSFTINTHFVADTEIVPNGTQTTDLKFLVTGHGSDPNYCCEFMSHNYQVILNGSSVATQTIWRSDCGANWLYPQSGTWLYQRANWCPGDMVFPYFNNLPGLTPGSRFNVGIQFDPYASSGGGGYQTEAALIYYGAMNKVLDASIDMIISPTTDMVQYRQNPSGSNPTILVKNTGSSIIDSITFKYGIQDSAVQTYTWVGTLASLQDTIITLPPIAAMKNVAGTSGTYTFYAEISSVNGLVDNDHTNDMMTSQFVAAPVWPSPFLLRMKTNNETITGSTSICETSWVIYDINNNIVQQRANANISTLFSDTVRLPIGCYRLQVYDSSCDGLAWWGFSGTGITNGWIAAYKMPSTALTFSQNSMTGTYSNDFGCGFTQYFYLDSSSVPTTVVSNVTSNGVTIEAYPNPAQELVNVAITGLPNVHGKIEIIDIMGRVVSEALCNDAEQQINVTQLVSGVYTILFINKADGNKLQTRLVITK